MSEEIPRGTVDPILPRNWLATVQRLNRLRQEEDAAARQGAESLADALFEASSHLIAYGSLAPGGCHATELHDLVGTWHQGWVTGTLRERGWGAKLGYPALAWDPHSDRRVPAHLLVSTDLPRHWARIDAFEGDGYRRILVPFHGLEGFTLIGNLYAAAG